jgi:hypothetical protein
VGIVAIESLEIGMVLASDVHDRSGRLLLGEGAELNQKHLVIFRTWGVLEADIVGQGGTDASDTVPSDVDPAQLEAARAALIPLYKYSNLDHPAIAELFKLAALRKVKHGTA